MVESIGWVAVGLFGSSINVLALAFGLVALCVEDAYRWVKEGCK